MNKTILVIVLIFLVSSQDAQQADLSPQGEQPNNQQGIKPRVITQQELEQRRKEQQREKQQQLQKLKEDPEMKAKIEREERERAERTAKYKAEQARLRQMRQKQKQAAQRRKAAMQQDEKPQYRNDAPPETATQRIKRQQREKLKQVADSPIFRSIEDKLNHRTINFEVHRNIEEFSFNPGQDERMFISIRILTEKDNVFSLISDVDKDEPLKLYVYEDNSRVVAQSSAYFQDIFTFMAKAQSTYTLRFYNSGSLKLVTMGYNHHLSDQVVEKLYDGEEGKQHFKTAKQLINGLQQSINRLSQSQVLDHQNSKTLVGLISQYFGYQLVEIVAVLLICFLQVHLIKSMFKSSSIV